MYYVYIIKSDKKNSYYIGSTANLHKRVSEHNENQVRSTKYKGPWKLICHEEVETKYQALRREHYLKGLKGNGIFKKLINAASPSSSLV